MGRLLIYVHYNKNNGLSEYVKYQLKKISYQFDEIVFISNSDLDNNQEKALNDYGIDKIIIRKNVGYDFAAWRDGLKSLDYSKLISFDSITLMNDTCFGPLWDLADYYNHFSSDKSVDFWGLTNHSEVSDVSPIIPEHLQSYFMVFHKSVITSTIFREFFAKVQDFSNVQDVIDNYETQLTKILIEKGFRYKCVLDTLTSLENKSFNFSLNYPRELLDAKVPFIKIKLFETHQFIAPYVVNEIKNRTDYPIDLIINHLSLVYLPDSIYKLNYKYVQKKYSLNSQMKSVAILLHVHNVELIEKAISYLVGLTFNHDIFITIESDTYQDLVTSYLEKYTMTAEVIVLKSGSEFIFKPLLLMRKRLSQYSYVGYCHTFTSDFNDMYAELFYIDELFEMMLTNAENILATLQNEPSTGLVIADIPTYFRYRRLIDADVEHELDNLLSLLWKEMKLKKEIDFSKLDTFVMSYGSFLWFKPESLNPLLQLPIDNNINSTLKDFGKSLERLPVYVAWAKGFDFKISPTNNQLTPFIDHKLLNRRKEIQIVEVIREVTKEVEKPIYPDFYIDMTGLSSKKQLLYLIVAPYRALKFIIKWNLLRLKRYKKGIR